nr:uncharacterized mitochondrial protein AtMg00810-like [Tanacetum cinerariifolium]
MSSAEAEYVVAAGCCAQVLWIKSRLADYDLLYDKVPIFCDNTSALAISNNPVLHSRTKHINIRKKKIISFSKPKTSKAIRESSLIKQVVETRNAKESVATADATKSLDASESAKELRNQPNPIDVVKANTAYRAGFLGVHATVIRRIENWSNALSCEVQALIRDISFAGYGVS